MPTNPPKSTNAPELTPYLPESLGASPVDQQRRYLLKASAGALGLALGGPLVAAADATPSVLETGGSHAAMLDAAEDRIYAVGLGHMRPDTDPDDMHGQAAAVFRDVHTMRTRMKDENRKLPKRAEARALYVESLALAVIASIYGHTRNWPNASPAFKAAKNAAARSEFLGETRAPGATMVADSLMAKVLLYMYPDKARTALSFAQKAAGEAFHPHLGQGPPPGTALALSLIARTAAARGDVAAAKTALGETERLMDSPHYFAAPFLSTSVPVDGPMSLFGYGSRAHLYTTAEVYAGIGDHEGAATAAAAYLAGPDKPSTTSATMARLLEPQALIAAGKVEAAAERAHEVLEALPVALRTPMLVHRGVRLLEQMHAALEGVLIPGPLDRYGAFIRRAEAPHSAAYV